jgi:hypothetical protein
MVQRILDSGDELDEGPATPEQLERIILRARYPQAGPGKRNYEYFRYVLRNQGALEEKFGQEGRLVVELTAVRYVDEVDKWLSGSTAGGGLSPLIDRLETLSRCEDIRVSRIDVNAYGSNLERPEKLSEVEIGIYYRMPIGESGNFVDRDVLPRNRRSDTFYVKFDGRIVHGSPYETVEENLQPKHKITLYRLDDTDMLKQLFDLSVKRTVTEGLVSSCKVLFPAGCMAVWQINKQCVALQLLPKSQQKRAGVESLEIPAVWKKE